MRSRALGVFLLAACAAPLPDGTVGVVESGVVSAPDLKSQDAGLPIPDNAASRARKVIAETAAPPSPAPATNGGIEQVTVTGHSLSGYWMVTGPRLVEVDAGLFDGVWIRYSPEIEARNICLIHDRQDSLDATCSAGSLQSALGERDGVELSLHWWRGPANLIFRGTLEDPDTIRGTLSGGMLGVSVTGGVPMILTRLLPEADQSETRGSARLLRAVFEDIAGDHRSDGRYEGKAMTQLEPQWQELRAAGAPLAITYLGTIRNRWRPKQRETAQDIYRVEFTGGVRLCRIGLGESGTVAEFECRGVPL